METTIINRETNDHHTLMGIPPTKLTFGAQTRTHEFKRSQIHLNKTTLAYNQLEVKHTEINKDKSDTYTTNTDFG